MTETEKKFCNRCQRHKSLRSFHNDKGRTDGKYPWCILCRNKYAKDNPGNPDRRTGDDSRVCETCGAGIGGSHPNAKYCGVKCSGRAVLARKYGMTVAEYNQLIASMEGKCPICERVVRRWNIDHCHDTGESFGPVCTQCNTKVLAWVYHNPQIARNLVKFLEEPPIRVKFGERFVTEKKANETKKASRYRNASQYPNGRRRRKGNAK